VGFQDSKLCNKLAGRPNFLQKFTAVVEEDCNLNQKYLIIRKYFALIIAFSLGFPPAGQFDSSCLYNPLSDREIDVNNFDRLPNVWTNYCAGFLSRPG